MENIKDNLDRRICDCLEGATILKHTKSLSLMAGMNWATHSQKKKAKHYMTRQMRN